MADNTELPSGSGGDVLRTEDRTTYKTPVSLIDVGGTAGEALIGDSGVAMPCKGAGTAGTANSGVMTVQGIASMTPIAVSDNSSSLTVDNNGTFAVQAVCTNAGTFAVQAVCTNAGTFAVQSAQSGSWTVSGTGTAGSAATGVMTIQGIASMTPVQVSQATASNLNATVVGTGTFAVQVDGAALTALQLIDNAIYVDDADWTATSSSHTLIGGVYQSTPGTITDGDTGPLRVNANGALHVAIVSGAGSGGTASDDDADFTAGATAGTPAMGVYELSPTSVTDGDLGVVGITATRAMRVYDNQVSDDVQSLINPIDDSYASSSKNGIFAGVIRKDTFATVAGSDGDMTILQVDANGALRVTIDSFADDADFTAAPTSGLPSMGVYESSPTSITDGDLGIVGLTQTRAMRVSVDNTVTVASHNVTNAGTFAVQAVCTNAGTFAVQATCTNAGTFAVQESGGALTALQIIDDWDESDRCKTNPIVGQAGVAANQGAVGATVQRVVQAGSTPFKNIDVDESEDAVKASAGTLRAFVAINTTNAIIYLKFYNLTVGDTTVGTSTPVLTIPIPGNGDTDGAGIVWNTAIYFDTAITIAATTGVADADTGAPGANALIVSGCYD